MKKKILLADDLELFLELEKTFFKRGDFELFTAVSGSAALEIIRKERPDLVLIDLHMSEISGDECCRRVKADPELRPIPVIIISQINEAHALELCRAAGCDDVLLKPINRHLFVETARRLLSLQHRQAPRIAARICVRYGAGAEQLTDYSVNISAGGLFLETENPLPLDTILKLEFTLPSRSVVIRCQARVAWVNHPEFRSKPDYPTGVGVQMLDLTCEDLHAIREFIKDQCLTASW